MRPATRVFQMGPVERTLLRMANATPPAAQRAIGEIAAAVARLKDGEAQALFGFVRRLGLTDEQADDAVQEVFVRMLAVQREGVGIANPRAWAYRSIYRLAMDQHRLRARIAALIDRIVEQPKRQAPDATDRIAVWTEVGRLPARQRQVIYLRYRADLEYEEIGQVLGISSSTARSHATQAVTTLRTRLTGTIEDVG